MNTSNPHAYRMVFSLAPPSPSSTETKGIGTAWLESLTPPRRRGAHPLTRNSSSARNALADELLLERGAFSCRIIDTTAPAPARRDTSDQTQLQPVIHVPALHNDQWHDLTLLSRPIASRWPEKSAESILKDILHEGDRNGIRLLPALNDIRAHCTCTSKVPLCQHAAAALHQAARCFDTWPLALLLLRGRAATDFLAGLQDPTHPTHHPHYSPATPMPPTIPARLEYARWEPSTRPHLPTPLTAPEQAGTPQFDAPPGTDATALHLLATDTALRAHTMLSSLLSGTTPAEPNEAVPDDPASDALRLAARHHLGAQQRRRMYEALETRA